MRRAAIILALAAAGCAAGPSETAPPPPVVAPDPVWWHGAWVVDTERLEPGAELPPEARKTARALVAGIGEHIRFELGPERVRRVVAGEVSDERVVSAEVSPERAVLTLPGAREVVLETAPEGATLIDAAGRRPVRRAP